MRTCFAFFLAGSSLFTLGCGSSQSTTPPSSSSKTSTATNDSVEPSSEEGPSTALAIADIKRVDASSFTLGSYLPPLDDGRIEVAPPADWNPLPRDSKYVVRFYKESRNSLPRIDIVVEESRVGGLTDVTEANVSDFTAAFANEAEANGTKLIEAPVPMVIGSVPCARIVSKLKLKIGAGTIPVERQTLAVLHGSRLYKINLLVDINKLSESRDAAYAICSGLKFASEESDGS